MLGDTSALGLNGAHEWLLVRISAIVICLYIIYVTGFLLLTDTITYETLCSFFATFKIKVFTLFALYSVLLHAWIGMWQVLTDYVKLISLRILLQLVVIVVLVLYLSYGTILVWGCN